jgi:hypothetical protein
MGSLPAFSHSVSWALATALCFPLFPLVVELCRRFAVLLLRDESVLTSFAAPLCLPGTAEALSLFHAKETHVELTLVTDNTAWSSMMESFPEETRKTLVPQVLPQMGDGEGSRLAPSPTLPEQGNAPAAAPPALHAGQEPEPSSCPVPAAGEEAPTAIVVVSFTPEDGAGALPSETSAPSAAAGIPPPTDVAQPTRPRGLPSTVLARVPGARDSEGDGEPDGLPLLRVRLARLVSSAGVTRDTGGKVMASSPWQTLRLRGPKDAATGNVGPMPMLVPVPPLSGTHVQGPKEVGEHRAALVSARRLKTLAPQHELNAVDQLLPSSLLRTVTSAMHWQRLSGPQEAVALLAGLGADDATQVVNRLLESQLTAPRDEPDEADGANLVLVWHRVSLGQAASSSRPESARGPQLTGAAHTLTGHRDTDG